MIPNIPFSTTTINFHTFPVPGARALNTSTSDGEETLFIYANAANIFLICSFAFHFGRQCIHTKDALNRWLLSFGRRDLTSNYFRELVVNFGPDRVVRVHSSGRRRSTRPYRYTGGIRMTLPFFSSLIACENDQGFPGWEDTVL
jgi:hypothetical protein